MIPDVERVVHDFLTGHTAAGALGTRYVGRTPQNTGGPWVRVTLLDAPNVTGAPVEHLINAMVQLDVYAGGQGEVITHARTIRAALHDDMPAAEHDDVVVTAVRITGMARIPDADFEPARERVILTAELTVHSA